MKTTLDIPDAIFRRAKSQAAKRGMPLRQFVTQAVEQMLKSSVPRQEKPWIKHLGKLKHLRKETQRINKLIEDTFEQVEAQTSR